MSKPASSLEEIEKRNHERDRKAEQYTAGDIAPKRAVAKTHAAVGNNADTAITAVGSKTMGMVTGFFWGALRGGFAGFLIAAAGTAFLPFMAATPAVAFTMYMGATMLFTGIQGVREGYYNATNNGAPKVGKKVGDEIAAAGGAQPAKVKEKVMSKAVEKAEKEIEDTKLLPVPSSSSPKLSKGATHYRDMVSRPGPSGPVVHR